ncbi:MAG TPA: carbohydrate ABC transporter permease, partial [Fimbriimonas sp.]|nr:carbohydrate ABC transporter permease [Fimbriimonas sp.]
TSRLNEKYQAWLRTKFETVKELNDEYLEENVAIQTVTPPAEMLERPTWVAPQGRKYQDWLIFKATLPAEYRIPIRRERLYQEWLRVESKNRVSDVPTRLNPKKEVAFEKISIPTPEPQEFAKAIPARYREVTADSLWHKKHSSPMPITSMEESTLQNNAKSIRGEFAGRNYRFVIDYVLLHGSAVTNTILFCGLAILTQLIVNPLAAYALSRYPIKASGKVLIFLLATMAFPAEVTMIPSFLLLKELSLLNTFAALVLPSAASGYMIFLLKGFFDSLPAELYEAGQMDGAKESTMLTKIALPLSKPVLGYLALMAFMASYSTFMFAFLVVQDQKMWTLMVWIYQLQTTAPKAVVMAALTLAALPTLVVFLFAQKVIMRGIVLPGDK